eukprot:9810541-Ditylum_brightwellii.AAC.1
MKNNTHQCHERARTINHLSIYTLASSNDNQGRWQSAQLPQESARKFTVALLSLKNKTSECWIAYEGSMHGIAHWLSKHPGRMHCLMSAAGQDATSVMNSLYKAEMLLAQREHMPRLSFSSISCTRPVI